MNSFNFAPLSLRARELAFQRYLNALEHGDDETVEAVLSLAAQDAALCERIGAANEALWKEMAPQLTPEIAPHAQIVEDLARKHLPLAFEEPQPRALTFGEAAQELAKRREISAGDLQLSKQMSNDGTPLPPRLSLPEIRKIGRALAEGMGLTGATNDRFWRELHGAAVRLVKRHTHRSNEVRGWNGLQPGLAREENSRRSTQPKKEEDAHDDPLR